jgi:hypothetical protein
MEFMPCGDDLLWDKLVWDELVWDDGAENSSHCHHLLHFPLTVRYPEAGTDLNDESSKLKAQNLKPKT